MFRNPSRVRSKFETPRLAILFTIAEHWNLPAHILLRILETAQLRTDILVPAVDFKYCREPNRNPLSSHPEWKAYNLAWCHSVPEWRSSFYMYIWELHQTVPSVENAIAFLNQAEDEHWQLLLLRTSTSSPSAKLRETFLSKSRTMFGAHAGAPRNTASEVASILLSMLETLCRDNRRFRNACVTRISELRMLGRRRPSRHKINFLTHLDDFRQAAQLGLVDANWLLKDISEHVNANTSPASSASNQSNVQTGANSNTSAQHPLQDLVDRCRKVEVELDYLAHDLDKLGKLLADAREMVKQQIDLRQIGLSMVLALLAAIYLPFSFVSGMFGMNVKDPLWPHHYKDQNNTKPRSEQAVISHSSTPPTVTATSISLPNLTDALGNALSSQPSNHLWSFKQFWYIAVAAAAATIFLPIIAGPAFRAIVQFSDKHKELWRIAVFICAVAGITTATILEGYYASIVLGAIQGGIAAVGLGVSHMKRTRVRRWIAFATILAACLLSDLQLDLPNLSRPLWYIDSGTWPSLTGIIPPIWLFVLWMRASKSLINVRAVNEFLSRIPIYRVPLVRFSSSIASYKNAPTKKQRIINGCAIVASAGLNVVLSFTLPSILYLGLSFTSFGLYALHKVFWSVIDRKDRRFWLLFAVVVVGSDLWWWYDTVGHYAGVGVLFPGLTLWAFHSKEMLLRVWKGMTATFHDRGSGNVSSV
jgi:hypothetical protein